MQYRYVAYNHTEGIIEGKLDAPSIDDARQIVTQEGRRIIRLTQARQMPAPEVLFPTFFRVKRSELTRFFRQLATTLDSGASIQRALELLQEESTNRKLRRVLSDVRTSIDGGETFSDALADHPDVFSETFVSIVRVGEFTGNLAPSLEQLAESVEREEESRQRVIKTLLMPMINLVAAFMMLVIMMTVVLPPIFESFESRGTEIPLSMRAAMGLSEFITTNIFAVMGGLVVVGSAFAFGVRYYAVRYQIDRIKLGFPVLGNLMVSIELSNFSSTAHILLDSGIALAEALPLARESIKSLPLKVAIEDAEDSLMTGRSLADALGRHKVIPSIWRELIKVGEETNTLGQTFKQLAVAYQKQAEHQLSGLLGVLEPVSTLVVGGMVAFLALSNVQMVQSSLSSLGQ